MKYPVLIIAFHIYLLLIPNNLNAAYGSGGVTVEHWVGLQPKDFLGVDAANKNGTDETWKLRVLDKSRNSIIGYIVATFQFSSGRLEFIFQSIESDTTDFKITPHLLPNRLNARAYLTVLDMSRDRKSVKVNFLDQLGEVWITPDEGYEGWLTSKSLRRGNRLRVNNSNSIIVEYVNPNSLIVRSMQEADWNCSAQAGEETTFKSFTTRTIPRKDWINENGRSIFTFESSGC